MLGIGIDYAIQMHARVEEEVILDRADHPIQETARDLGPALLVVTFDAIFAFAALRFAKVPMIRHFGLLLAVGIAVDLPVHRSSCPLAALGIREYKSPTTGKDFREGYLGRLVVRLGSLPAWAAIPLAVASLAVFLAGPVRRGRPRAPDRPDPVGQPGVQARSRTSDEVEEQVGSSSELGVFVQGRRRLHRRVHRVRPRLRRTTPLAEYPDDAPHRVEHRDHGRRPASTSRAPATSRPPARRSRRRTTSRPTDIQVSTVSPDATAFNMIFQAGPELARPAGGGRAPAPGGNRPAGGHLGHAVGPGRGRASACSTTSRPTGSC